MSIEAKGLKGLNNKSRIMGDHYVRFCERIGVKFPWSTRPSEGNNLGNIPNSILLVFWEKLGQRYGFKWETAQASTKGGRYYLATPDLNNHSKEMEAMIPFQIK